MRLFSFMLWHHLAYLVISMALLGLGVGGTISAVFTNRIKQSTYLWLSLTTDLASIITVLALVVLSRFELDTFRLNATNLAVIGLYYTLLALPFACAGFVLSTAFTVGVQQIGLLYSSDLLGAAAGSILFFFIIEPLGLPLALGLSICLLSLAGLLFAFDDSTRLALPISLLTFLVLVVFLPSASSIISPHAAPSKFFSRTLQRDSAAQVLFTRWTPIARIDFLSSTLPTNPFAPLTIPPSNIRAITIDGDATTWMFRHPDVRQIPPKPPVDPLSSYQLAFMFLHQPDVLIIGPGGSNEIYSSIQMGAAHITGVELNPAILSLSTDLYADFVGHVYDLPNTQAIAAEGRSYVRQTDHTFDLIQMSGVDTWSGLSSGAYVLSENYLYTVEAFSDFLRHLSPNGILSIGRWNMTPPRESLRMVSIAWESLSELGVPDPSTQIIVFQHADPRFVRLLVRNSPFTEPEIQDLTHALEDVHGIIYAAPGLNASNAYAKLIEAYQSGNEEKFFNEYPYAVNPVYDDRPYFFEYYRWTRLPQDIANPTGGGSIGADRPVGITVLLALLLQSSVLTLVFMILPLKLIRKGTGFQSFPLRTAFYFIMLGVAFMFVEVTLMQKLVLFLGHPAYSIPVVLASLLGSAALGSFLVPVIKQRMRLQASFVLLCTGIFLLATSAYLPYVVNTFLGISFTYRIIISVLAVSVVGIPMGTAFPLGLAAISKSHPASVAWAWAVNGASSVVGSVLVIIISMGIGFTAAILIASFLYIASFFFFPSSKLQTSGMERPI